MKKTIGIFGGEGILPKIVIEEIKKKEYKVVLLAVKGITNKEIESLVDDIFWFSLTRIGTLIKYCIANNIKEIITVGRVKHNIIFSLSTFRMDWTTIKLWFSFKDFRVDTMLKSIVDLFNKFNINILDSTKFIPDRLAKKGVLTSKCYPSKKDFEDIELGIKSAKLLGSIDAGQSVIIKNKSIVALEAMEGTDKCIERSYQIAGEGCILVKMAKPNQNMKFDVPVIGKNTIMKLKNIKAKGIAIEKGKTIMLESDICQFADRLGIFIVAV